MGVCKSLRMSPRAALVTASAVPFTYQLARLAAGGLYAAPAPRFVGAHRAAPCGVRHATRTVAPVWRMRLSKSNMACMCA